MFNNRFLTGFDGMSRFEIKLNTVTIVTIGGYVASDFISNCNYAATQSSLNFLDQDNGVTIMTRCNHWRYDLGPMWHFPKLKSILLLRICACLLGLPSDYTVSNCHGFSLREICNSKFLNQGTVIPKFDLSLAQQGLNLLSFNPYTKITSFILPGIMEKRIGWSFHGNISNRQYTII